MKHVLILNGPNLNLLGVREPEKYGHHTLDDVTSNCKKLAQELELACELKQSNHEGAIIDWIHEAREHSAAIIINAGAFTHYSYAIFDALNAFDGVVIEVHISNVHQREEFRHHSVISARADGIIIGCGIQGYELALQRVASLVG